MEVNGTIFLQIFIFASLLMWLSPTLFAPIMRLFDERESRIVGAKNISLELNALAEEKHQSFLAEFDRAKEEARIVMAEQKHAMEKEANEILERAKMVVRAKLSVAEKDLAEQEATLRASFDERVSFIADEIVAQISKKKTITKDELCEQGTYSA